MSPFLGGEAVVEDPVQVIGFDARTVVFQRDHELVLDSQHANRQAFVITIDFVKGLLGVANEIDHDLKNSMSVGDRRGLLLRVAHNFDL